MYKITLHGEVPHGDYDTDIAYEFAMKVEQHLHTMTEQLNISDMLKVVRDVGNKDALEVIKGAQRDGTNILLRSTTYYHDEEVLYGVRPYLTFSSFDATMLVPEITLQYDREHIDYGIAAATNMTGYYNAKNGLTAVTICVGNYHSTADVMKMSKYLPSLARATATGLMRYAVNWLMTPPPPTAIGEPLKREVVA